MPTSEGVLYFAPCDSGGGGAAAAATMGALHITRSNPAKMERYNLSLNVIGIFVLYAHDR